MTNIPGFGLTMRSKILTRRIVKAAHAAEKERSDNMPQGKSIDLHLSRDITITDPEQAKQFLEDKAAFERHAKKMGQVLAFLDEQEKSAEENNAG